MGGNADITYVKGDEANDISEPCSDVNWQAESLENGGGTVARQEAGDTELLKMQKNLREEAVRLAAARKGAGDKSVSADAAGVADGKEAFLYDTVVFIGGQNHLQDLEGHDRPDMKLPYAQDLLIENLLEVRPDMVTVLMSGSPVEMPWLEAAGDVSGIIFIWAWAFLYRIYVFKSAGRAGK